MRPNHQNNKRMRGRNRSGGGKGPNPLSRTYESNGPDVKVRGTAQHIAEKYLQLARDAQASGDPITAESYLQHAEHYLRLIAAAQEQFRQQNPHYRPFEVGAEDGDEGDEDGQPYVNGGPQPDVRFPSAALEGETGEGQPRQREFQPREPRERDFQPRQREFQPREQRGDYQPREPREQRGDYQPREPREQRGDYQPREPREQRGDYQPRESRDYQQREPREPREFQPRQDSARQDAEGQPAREQREFQPRGEGREFPRRDDKFPRRGPRPERAERQAEPAEPAAALPAFITAPVRQPVAVEPEPAEAPVAVASPASEAEAGEFPVRARRRRTRARTGEGTEPVADEAPVQD